MKEEATKSQTDAESFVANLCCDWLLQLLMDIFLIAGDVLTCR